MTIELRDVTKKVRLGSVRMNYRDLNIRIEDKANVAFLGHKSAGMEGIVNLICNADAPDEGKVTRSHSISWPIPASTFLHKHHSLATSARFIARLYEQDPSKFLADVSDMAQLGEFQDVRGDRCPKEVLSRFAYSVGLCVPFDRYILTAVSAGAKEDRPRFAEILQGLRERAGILLVTHDVKSASLFCDQAYVFDEGRATYFDDMEAAAEYFSKASGDDDDDVFFDAEPELQDMVSMDF
jgi:capsular polysaccharide transport system ATP-binding protein